MFQIIFKYKCNQYNKFIVVLTVGRLVSVFKISSFSRNKFFLCMLIDFERICLMPFQTFEEKNTATRSKLINTQGKNSS